MNSCWNVYSCFILPKSAWILSMWIERTKMESFPTKSRVKTLFSMKHTEQPCSAHCFSLALQQLLSAHTHFYLHWQYPLQTNLILFSTSHSRLVFLFHTSVLMKQRGLSRLEQRPLFCVQKSCTQLREVCVRGKAFAAMKISRWQLCNQYILWPPVSSITLLMSSQCLINLALCWWDMLSLPVCYLFLFNFNVSIAQMYLWMKVSVPKRKWQ